MKKTTIAIVILCSLIATSVSGCNLKNKAKETTPTQTTEKIVLSAATKEALKYKFQNDENFNEKALSLFADKLNTSPSSIEMLIQSVDVNEDGTYKVSFDAVVTKDYATINYIVSFDADKSLQITSGPEYESTNSEFDTNVVIPTRTFYYQIVPEDKSGYIESYSLDGFIIEFVMNTALSEDINNIDSAYYEIVYPTEGESELLYHDYFVLLINYTDGEKRLYYGSSKYIPETDAVTTVNMYTDTSEENILKEYFTLYRPIGSDPTDESLYPNIITFSSTEEGTNLTIGNKDSSAQIMIIMSDESDS